MRQQPIVIIGGGVAGLAAANRLIDLGQDAVVIEAKHYPLKTLCGEFVSPTALPYLEQWGLAAARALDSACFRIGATECSFSLQPHGYALARSDIELQLKQRFERAGGRLLEGIAVEDREGKRLRLSSGELLEAAHLIESSGRRERPVGWLCGRKAHVPLRVELDGLDMELFSGGYIGAVAVGEGRMNLAQLSLHPSDPPQAFMERHQIGDVCWQEARVPFFRSWPTDRSRFVVGDALGGIPPILGLGLGIAVVSGALAAEYAVHGDVATYHKVIRAHFERKATLARLIHGLLLRSLGRQLLRGALYFPSLQSTLWKYLHGT